MSTRQDRTPNNNSIAISSPPAFILLISAAVFLVTLWLSVWRNHFPACYHPDEPEKFAQVLSGDRNFRHPPLMLDAATLVLRLVSSDRHPATSDHAVVIGRWLSAFYIAGACAVLTFLGGLYGGTLAAMFAAIFLALNKHAVLAGHFFKEDSLFALGLSFAFIAGAYHWRKPRTWSSLVALGAAAGFAAGTKYLGIVTLVYAIALELISSRRLKTTPNLLRRVAILIFTAFVVMFLVSVRSGWNHFGTMMQAIVTAGETAHLGNEGVGAKIPHARYLGIFFLEPPLALIGFACCWWLFARNARAESKDADRWFLLCTPLALLILFSFSAITAVRYFLPVSLLVACIGGVGMAGATRILREWARERWKVSRTATTCAMLGLCAVGQLPALLPLERGFAIDDHLALRSYIARELPTNAVIAVDQLSCLGAASELPQRIITREKVADLGDLDSLRAQGITHVVVCWYDSRRYIKPTKHAEPRAESDFLRRRDFYLKLKNHGWVRWQSELVQPYPLHPGLSLYELSPATSISP